MKSIKVAKPALSIIVIFHNMNREADRTLYSLSTAYQTGVTDTDYEIIAIDNGSIKPLSEKRVHEFGQNFKYHFFETESVSPVSAVNFGARIANGQFVAVIVDGARMSSPGLVSMSMKGLKAFADPFVCALAWHLGPDVQNKSVGEGYDQAEEDRLLESINWPMDGYRLFEISTLAPSSKNGFFGGLPAECSWLCMPRVTFLEINGFDERFQAPGGGFVNHDFLVRNTERSEISPVIILGEGTFHQAHGGVATNVLDAEHQYSNFKEEYQKIHGKPFVKASSIDPHYFGKIPDFAKRFLASEITKESPTSIY